MIHDKLARSLWLGTTLALFACGPRSTTSTTTPGPTPPVRDAGARAAAPSPEARARAIIGAQLAAAHGTSDDNHAALAATFAPDAVVIASDDVATGDAYVGRQLLGANGEPGTVTRLIADGTPRAVWFDAELTMHGPSGDYPIRAVELAAADADWKVVAAAITPLRAFAPTHAQRTIDRATAAGRLTELLLSGSPSPLAVGPDATDLADDAVAAQRILADFASRSPALGANVPREIVHADYGFVQVGVELTAGHANAPSRALAQLFAVPAPNHSWSVVLVHYLAE